MGRLEYIEIENFKSYGGTHHIGPLENFSCIIGPNGAGKSNLMDAISFVLGVQSKQLRSSNMKELLYRKDENSPPARKSYVKLIYSISPQEVISFKRSITSTGTSTYMIQDSEVTFDEYVAELKKIGVLVKARNFLVFQGDVESIASKTPLELSKWIENICESDALIPQYQQFLKQKNETQESTVSALQKKKMFVNQCKEVKEQKDEADMFLKKSEDLKRTQVDSILWKIRHCLSELISHERGVEDIQSQLEKLESQSTSLQSTIQQLKKIIASDSNDTNRDRKLQNLRHQLSKFRSDLSSVTAKKVAASKKIKALDDNIDKANNDISQQDREVEDLKNELNGILLQVERKLAELSSVSTHRLSLNPSQQQRFDALKIEATSATLSLRTELGTIDSEVKTVQKEIAMEKMNISGVQSDLDYHTQAMDDQMKRITKAKTELSAMNMQLEECEKTKSNIQQQFDLNQSRVTELVSALNVVDDRLRKAGDDKRRFRHENRLSEAVENMKSLIPGVFGRLHDLCKPIQKQYSLAITVAGGKMMEAVVVDTTKTAADCIQYLKEQRVGVCSFIPLNNIKDSAGGESRSFGPTFKSCVDLVTCDDSVKPAVRFVFDRVIVSDTLDNARRLCYGQGENVKVVTLQGHIIHRSGSMTGGVGREATDIWEAKEIESLTKEKSHLENQLAALKGVDDLREALYEQEGRRRQLLARIAAVTAEISTLQQRLTNLQSHFSSRDKDLKEAKVRLGILNQEEARLIQKLNNVQERIDATERDIFAPLSAETGVANLGAVEKEAATRSEAMTANIASLKAREAEIRGQLQYLSSRNPRQILSKLQEELGSQKEVLATLVASEDSLLSRRSTVEKELEIEEKNRNIVEDSFHEKKQKVTALSQSKGDLEVKIKALRQKEATEINAGNRIRNQIRDIIKTAPITLPTTPDSKKSVDGLVLGNVDILRSENGFVDLSALSNKLPSHRDENEFKNFFEDRIKELTLEINSMQPNFHAADKLSSLMDKVAECSDDLDKLKEEFMKASTNFDAIKKKRKQLFENCFNHIASSLNKLYKELTKSSRHPMGGNASLTLENIEEPYLGGVRFTAMPPMKRFRDMEQLSGGEKTVAALALLFSIHSYHPAPFFVLDEIDAALDNVNVAKISQYVLNKSSESQFLVISLKDMFFAKADALIGTCRDIARSSSKTFSLDLRQFQTHLEEVVGDEGMEDFTDEAQYVD